MYPETFGYRTARSTGIGLLATRRQMMAIRAMAADGLSTRAIAAKLTISHTSVHRIVQGTA